MNWKLILASALATIIGMAIYTIFLEGLANKAKEKVSSGFDGLKNS